MRKRQYGKWRDDDDDDYHDNDGDGYDDKDGHDHKYKNDDKLYGGDGKDHLDGGKGNDKLYGGDDKDTLYGGKGNDYIEGGKGNDKIDGGSGHDTIVFSGVHSWSNGLDTISGFVSDDDTLQFSLYSVNSAITGADLFEGEVDAGNVVIGGGGAALDADDYFIYDTDDGALYFDYNGSGAGGAVQLATLVGAPAVAVDDFMLA